IPIEPANIEASSVRMSPNIFSVTITSKLEGCLINCIAQVSTKRCSSDTSGYASAIRSAVRRQSREVLRTLALSTDVTFLRLPRDAECPQLRQIILHHFADRAAWLRQK